MAYLSSLLGTFLDLYIEDDDEEGLICASSDSNRYLESLCEIADNIIKKIRADSDSNYDNYSSKIKRLANYTAQHKAYINFNSFGSIYITVEDDILDISFACLNNQIPFLDGGCHHQKISYEYLKNLYLGARITQESIFFNINIRIKMCEVNNYEQGNKSKLIFDGRKLRYIYPKNDESFTPVPIQQIERNSKSYSNLSTMK